MAKPKSVGGCSKCRWRRCSACRGGAEAKPVAKAAVKPKIAKPSVPKATAAPTMPKAMAGQTAKRRVNSCWGTDYVPLDFCSFVAERQAVLVRREAELPREEWTPDPVLRRGRFCNIDRRDDAVTRELVAAWARPGWGWRQRLILAVRLRQSPKSHRCLRPGRAFRPLQSALRFTSSRRGVAAQLAALLDEGGLEGLVAALCDGGAAGRSGLCRV